MEERHEKVTNAEGESRETTLRRIGDKWYENEVHSDKEGKKTQKESWHNVPETEFEAFQNQWKDKSALTHSKPDASQKPAPAKEEKPALTKDEKPAPPPAQKPEEPTKK
jgi:hypothetical protein